MHKTNEKGISVPLVLLSVCLVAVLAIGGWFIYQKNQNDRKLTGVSQETPKGNQPSNNLPAKSADPSEGGKYLVIKEWAIRAPLPSGLENNVIYRLSAPQEDPDGNILQAANILMKNNDSSTFCAPESTVGGDIYIKAGIQVLRSKKAKPFDVTRYKGEFKKDIAENIEHTYHLNYITPSCASESTTQLINQLQKTLENIETTK